MREWRQHAEIACCFYVSKKQYGQNLHILKREWVAHFCDLFMYKVKNKRNTMFNKIDKSINKVYYIKHKR